MRKNNTHLLHTYLEDLNLIHIIKAIKAWFCYLSILDLDLFAFCTFLGVNCLFVEKAIFATLLDLLFNNNQHSVANGNHLKNKCKNDFDRNDITGGNQIEATYFAYCNMKWKSNWQKYFYDCYQIFHIVLPITIAHSVANFWSNSQNF